MIYIMLLYVGKTRPKGLYSFHKIIFPNLRANKVFDLLYFINPT